MSDGNQAKVGDFVVLPNGRVGRYVRFDGESATVVSGLDVVRGVEPDSLRLAFSGAKSDEEEVR